MVAVFCRALLASRFWSLKLLYAATCSAPLVVVVLLPNTHRAAAAAGLLGWVVPSLTHSWLNPIQGHPNN